MIGFVKVKALKANESRDVFILFDTDDLREYDEEIGKMTVVSDYKIIVE